VTTDHLVSTHNSLIVLRTVLAQLTDSARHWKCMNTNDSHLCTDTWPCCNNGFLSWLSGLTTHHDFNVGSCEVLLKKWKLLFRDDVNVDAVQRVYSNFVVCILQFHRQTRSQAVSRIADQQYCITADYLVISDCCRVTWPHIMTSMLALVKSYLKNESCLWCDHLIHHRPYPICFSRQFIGKTHRLTIIHTLQTDDRQADATL